jgi:hypothetical protein
MIGKKNILRTADKLLYSYLYFAPLSSSILIVININMLPQKKMCSKCKFISGSVRKCTGSFLESLCECLKDIGHPVENT